MFRIEKDSLGEIAVPADKYWGAQTERSRRNFPIGDGLEKMPEEVITALAVLKRAAAAVNFLFLPEKMTQEKLLPLLAACDEVIGGTLAAHFPLLVWQTGSGTQTNMNVNEVLANRANEILGRKLLHPNDDVNLSQSSNDIFPSAMHMAAVLAVEGRLFPALDGLIAAFARLEEENRDVLKCGRTHLQDAVPMRFSQEISGWRSALETDRKMLQAALEPLRALAAGGTAVGTGLNAPEGFDRAVAAEVSRLTGSRFEAAENKFHALAFRDELVFAHGALKTLAADLMKIANDIRFLAGGPRCGLGEITIPANEPGSSIMPGKVNPTQCEAVTMIAAQVMGNDVTVGLAASQGHFELNVYMPVMIYNFLQSVRLLGDGMRSFEARCVSGIRPVKEKMRQNLEGSLMLVTALSPHIGYEKAAQIAQKALREDLSIRDACLSLGFMTPEDFDAVFHPEEMV